MKKSHKPLEKCPKCSGTTGYKLIERMELIRGWDGSAQDANSLGTNKTAVCQDCGHRFPAERAA